MSSLLKYIFWYFLIDFYKKLPYDEYGLIFGNIFDFKKLFSDLDLFIMALCSSLVVNGGSFHLHIFETYFSLIGAYLLKLQKKVFLKRLREGASKLISLYPI